MSIGANCSDGHASYDPDCPGCVESRMSALLDIVEQSGSWPVGAPGSLMRRAQELGKRLRDGQNALALLPEEVTKLQDALGHIRAVCEAPKLMSFPVNLQYVARVAREALRGSKPWHDRPRKKP